LNSGNVIPIVRINNTSTITNRRIISGIYQLKLICLDEPTAALAPILAQEVLDKLVEISNLGTTILLIEQNAK
jgi:ABC-type branched-subunit amino acid transport system ATPase component